MKPESPQEFQQLIALFLSGEISPEEKKQLDVLVSKNSQVNLALEDAHGVWEATGIIHEEFRPNEQAALRSVLHTIDTAAFAADSENIPSRNFKQVRLQYFAIAATAAILVLVGILVLPRDFQNQKKSVPVPEVTGSEWISVAADEDRDLYLPDQSLVRLHANSSVEYLADFSGDLREVRLIGEAFFEVTRDENRPFVVRTAASETQVLGTSFTIRAMPGESTDELTVHSGKVHFSALEADASQGAVLTRDQCSILAHADGRLEVSSTLPAKLIAARPKVKLSPYERESASPSAYLIPSFEVNTNFLKRTVIRLKIKNAASIASFSNIEVEVRYTTKKGERRQSFKIDDSISPDGSLTSKHRLKDWFVESKVKSVRIRKAKVSKARK